jgi:GDP-L-fucose synthase
LLALIRRFHEAKVTERHEVTVWGTGTPRLEFLHFDDLAGAALFLMEQYENQKIINVGVKTDISISELADIIITVVSFGGAIAYDTSKPGRYFTQITRH